MFSLGPSQFDTYHPPVVLAGVVVTLSAAGVGLGLADVGLGLGLADVRVGLGLGLGDDEPSTG
jgi:hypothetical protein